MKDGPDEMTQFEFYVESGLEQLRLDGWTDSKIAKYLRLKATELSPRSPSRKKTIRITGQMLLDALEDKKSADLKPKPY